MKDLTPLLFGILLGAGVAFLLCSMRADCDLVHPKGNDPTDAHLYRIPDQG